MNHLTLMIWKKLANMFFLAATAFVVASCGGGTPDCGSDEALSLAKQVISENTFDTDTRLKSQSTTGQQSILADWSTLRIDSVRFKGEDEKTKTKTCAARYLVDTQSESNKQVLARDIIYTVELTSKRGEIFVFVQDAGIPSFVQAEPAPQAASPSATANKQSKMDWRSFVQQNPYLFLIDPKVRAVLQPQTVSQEFYELLVLDSNIELDEMAIVDDNILLGSYCAKEACDQHQVFFMVNTQTDKFFATLYTPTGHLIAAGEDFKAPATATEIYQKWINNTVSRR